MVAQKNVSCGICRQLGHNVRTCGKAKTHTTNVRSLKNIEPVESLKKRKGKTAHPKGHSEPRKLSNIGQERGKRQTSSSSQVFSQEIITALQKGKFTEVNRSVQQIYSQTSNKREFFTALAKNELLNLVVTEKLLKDKSKLHRGGTTDEELAFVAERNPSFVVRMAAVAELHKRGVLPSTFSPVPKDEVDKARKVLTEYLMSDWEGRGYKCPQPQICKVRYHKVSPYVSWGREVNTVSSFNDFSTTFTPTHTSTGGRKGVQQKFPRHGVPLRFPFRCKYGQLLVNNAFQVWYASSEGGAGVIDTHAILSDRIPLAGMTSISVNKEVREVTRQRWFDRDDPYTYDRYEDVYEDVEETYTDVDFNNNWRYPYIYAGNVFGKVKSNPAHFQPNEQTLALNLRDVESLDIYATAKTLEKLKHLNLGSNWDWEERYTPQRTSIDEPKFSMSMKNNFTESQKKFYTQFLSSNSHKRMAMALETEYTNIPDYVKGAKFKAETAPTVDIARLLPEFSTATGVSYRSGGMTKVAIPLDEEPPSEVETFTAVVYRTKKGNLEFLDGAKRVRKALDEGRETINIIVGEGVR